MVQRRAGFGRSCGQTSRHRYHRRCHSKGERAQVLERARVLASAVGKALVEAVGWFEEVEEGASLWEVVEVTVKEAEELS